MAKNRFGVPIKTKPSKPKGAVIPPPSPEPETESPADKSAVFQTMLLGLKDSMASMSDTAMKREVTPRLIEAATEVVTCVSDEQKEINRAASEFLIGMFKLFGVKNPDPVPAPTVNTETGEITPTPERSDGEGQAAEGLVAE